FSGIKFEGTKTHLQPSIRDCHFEVTTGAVTEQIAINADNTIGLSIDSCAYEVGSSAVGKQFIKLSNASTKAVQLKRLKSSKVLVKFLNDEVKTVIIEGELLEHYTYGG